MIHSNTGEEEGWVEVRDADGKKAAMRHIATVLYGERTYLILGAVRAGGDGEEESGLLLVRREETEGGAVRYILAQDEEEIEHVIGGFVMRVIMEQVLDQEPEEFSDPEDHLSPDCCTQAHGPMEFCYCGDPDYLQ